MGTVFMAVVEPISLAAALVASRCVGRIAPTVGGCRGAVREVLHRFRQ
jgi:hypothetical protein